MGIPADRLPVLRERRSRAHHVVCDARRPLPRGGVRRVPPVHQGIRRAARRPSRDGQRRQHRDAAARRRSHATRIRRVTLPGPRKREDTTVTRRRSFSLITPREEDLRAFFVFSCLRGRGSYCCCCCVVAGFAAKSVHAFVETQFIRFLDSMKRPAFERAPKTTTATSWVVCGRRRTVARQ